MVHSLAKCRKGAVLCTNKDIKNRYFGTYGREMGQTSLFYRLNRIKKVGTNDAIDMFLFTVFDWKSLTLFSVNFWST